MPALNLRETFLAADIQQMLPHERIVYFALAAEAGRQHHEAQLEAMARKDLGHAYQTEHRYDEALASLRESLALLESLHDVQGQAGVLDDLGISCRAVSDFELAQRYFLKGLRLSAAAGLAELSDQTVSHLLTMLSYSGIWATGRPAAMSNWKMSPSNAGSRNWPTRPGESWAERCRKKPSRFRGGRMTQARSPWIASMTAPSST